uniref:Uncharacterized protein n=1 Tax=Oryza glumipatula TaxID=40148 RepID=A0A0D9YRN0_9ORYZ
MENVTVFLLPSTTLGIPAMASANPSSASVAEFPESSIKLSSCFSLDFPLYWAGLILGSISLRQGPAQQEQGCDPLQANAAPLPPRRRKAQLAKPLYNADTHTGASLSTGCSED